ncbi:InlB B-repeat-containing protein [Tenacibaculum maritimum]|uniref:InlB B-repeat-containing protein n=1 Tax=Tenacibaculum maritimum TaxID=107401 RepID=UPI003875F7AF
MKKKYLSLLFFAFAIAINGQTNLITDGGFENWSTTTTLSDWTTENNISQNSSDFSEGNFSASLVVTTDNIQPKVRTKVPMSSGVEYTVSYTYKYVDANYGGTHPINLNISRTGSATTLSSNRFASNNNWNEVTKSFIPDQTGNYDLSISTATFNGESFQVLIDNVKVYDKSNHEIVVIPDANFKNALLNHTPIIDTNNDLEIQVSEAEAYTGSLNVSHKNINSLIGIEAFINITALSCDRNNLTSLEINNNIHLAYLGCRQNKIATIDLAKNIALKQLFISHNRLTNLNLSENINLTNVGCVGNNLTDLNLSKNSKLTELFCFFNKITRLDLSKNRFLTAVSCRENELNYLNVANGNNHLLNLLSAESNPLSCIQVDDVTNAENNANWIKDPHTNYSTNCVTFTPEIVNIPDPNFKKALVSDPAINANGDTEIQVSEAYDATQVSVSDQNINDLTGIEAFLNITFLDSSNNNLTTLDLSKNTKLTTVWISKNNLTHLDLSKNIHLTGLSIYENSLTNIDLSNNTSLTNFTCSNNQLTNLDISKNVKLADLGCGGNKLTHLDLTQNTNLRELNCGDNLFSTIDLSKNLLLKKLICGSSKLTSLDVSNNNQLEIFSCASSALTNLDLSKNTALTHISCHYNELTNLNIANNHNTKITQFNATNNPNLYCISVDDVTYSNNNWKTIDNHTSFSTDCSSVKKLMIHSEGGTVVTNPSSTNGLFTNDTEVILTASPDAFHEFTAWSGAYTSTENPLNITMDTDKKITANYKKIKHTVTIISTHGTVTKTPDASNNIYDDGTEITLTASPNSGYRHTGWTKGNTTHFSNSFTTKITEDVTIIANYTQTRTLTLNANNGIVTTDPTPNHGTNNNYDDGMIVILTATPNPGFQFDSWSGDVSGNQNPLDLTMDTDKNVTAKFVEVPSNVTITEFATGFDSSLEGIAIDHNNTVYVSEHNTGKIYRVNTDGTRTVFASTGFRANDIAFNENNKLFVAEPFNGKILEADSSGELTQYVNAFGDSPYGVTFYNNSLYYVSENNSKVVKVDSNLTKTDVATQLFTPESTDFDSNGNMYITDRNDRKLIQISMNGTRTEVASGYPAIRGVVVVNDIVYFTTYSANTNKIVKYNSLTNTVSDYVTTNLQQPRNLEVDQLGNMYVTNQGNGSIIKIYDEDLKPQVTAGIDDESFSNSLNIFPNPATNNIQIHTNTPLSSIKVINLLGKEVLKTNSLNIDISTLPKGMYFLKIKGKNSTTATKKIIKQ